MITLFSEYSKYLFFYDVVIQMYTNDYTSAHFYLKNNVVQDFFHIFALLYSNNILQEMKGTY